MSGLRRGFADLTCRALQATLPLFLQPWGRAVRCETASIPEDGKALVFALSGLCGLLPRALTAHLLLPLASLIGDGGSNAEGSVAMSVYAAAMRRPRAVGVACAVGAVALGLVYMLVVGAPMRYLGINAGALMIGLATLGFLGRAGAVGEHWIGGVVAAIAGPLLATALLGDTVDGATRWVSFGGLSIQPSLILLPVMIVSVSRTCDARALVGIVAAAVAMAMQPDRAMAAMLAAGVVAIALIRRDRNMAAAAAISVAGFATALARADTLPPARYVDHILTSSLDVHPAAGVAALSGSVLLVVPAIVGWTQDPANRTSYAALACHGRSP